MNLVTKIQTAIIAISFAVLALFGVMNAQQAYATSHTDKVCDGVGFAGGSCDKIEGDTGIKGVITTIIDVLSIIVGAVSVIMIIIGGLRYITSSGDSAGVTSAKNTILYAIVGLVIVIFAQTIIAFVVGRVDSTVVDDGGVIKHLLN